MAVSVAGVITMGLILILVGGTLIATHGLNQVLQKEQQNVSQVRIYIADGVSLSAIVDYQRQLNADPRVKSTTLETKDQAEQDASNAFGDISQAISVIGHNPLPASINVDVKNLNDLNAIDTEARGNPLVDRGTPTDLKRDVIDKLQSAVHVIQVVGLVISLLLAFISLVIIMSTIRTAVYVRREEIEIMKLVGATDWFVRWPFILEGVMGGVLGAALAAPILAFGYQFILGLFPDAIRYDMTYDSAFLAVLILVLFIGGAAIGAFGAFLGVRRFLHV